MDEYKEIEMDPYDYYDEVENLLEEYSSEELLMELIERQGGEMTPELEHLLEYYQQRHGTLPLMSSSRIPLNEVFENCVMPSGAQVTQMLLPLIMLCLLFRFICYLNNRGLKHSHFAVLILHTCSALFGIMMLKNFFDMTLLYLVLCCGLSYLLFSLLCLFEHRQLCGLGAAVLIVFITVSCELIFVPTKIWHQIRGAQIILSMKIISLGSDIATYQVADLPNIIEYMGYCFNVGTVIFGPWVSYEDYYKMIGNTESLFDLRWTVTSIFKTFCAGVSLLYSNCFTHWIILDHYSKWLIAYRDAQSFRFSHYFISFVSDATSSLSGITSSIKDSQSEWNVVRPHRIEFPRSIVEVVTNWNLPMHHWLKAYVFKPVLPYGNFLAIIITYIASSLLHGLNFQLAAVLLSLGFYSYIEFVLRKRLSKVFDACVQAKKCKEKCDHMYTSAHPAVFLVNLLFGFLAIFHLAYLGLMFDSSAGEDKGYTMWHTLDKWAGLSFLSHWVALGSYVFYWLI